MKVSMRVDGGKDLARALGQLSARVQRGLAMEALEEGAEPMRAAVERHAPVEPGKPDIKEHIIISRVRGQRDLATVAVGPQKGFFYGFFQEFGTKFHGAQPFMRPAADTTWPQVIVKAGQALWRELAGRGIQRSASSQETPVQSDGRLL